MCGSRIRETASSASPTPLNQSVCWPSIRIRSGPSGATECLPRLEQRLVDPVRHEPAARVRPQRRHQVLEPARHHQEVDGRAQRKRRAEPLEGLLRAVEALLGALHEHDPPPRIELQQSGHRLPPRRDGHVVPARAAHRHRHRVRPRRRRTRPALEAGRRVPGRSRRRPTAATRGARGRPARRAA